MESAVIQGAEGLIAKFRPALYLEANDAAVLGVEPGVAGLRIVRTSFLSNRRVVEFTRSVYRGDAYDFVAELRLANS